MVDAFGALPTSLQTPFTSSVYPIPWLWVLLSEWLTSPTCRELPSLHLQERFTQAHPRTRSAGYLYPPPPPGRPASQWLAGAGVEKSSFLASRWDQLPVSFVLPSCLWVKLRLELQSPLLALFSCPILLPLLPCKCLLERLP